MEEWGLPVAVLVVGLAVGWFAVQRTAGGAGANVEAERRRLELESTRDEVLEALKQLDLEKDKLDPADYAAEREKLLARGARALEALDVGSAAAPVAPAPVAAPAPSARPAPAAGGLSPQWQGALYALGAVALGWLLWTFASNNSAARREGGSMTGSLPGEQQGPMASQDPTQSPEFQQREAMLKSALEANPSDLATLNQLTQLYLSHGVPQQAMVYNDQALKVDGKDHEARTLRALLTAMMGMFDKALVDLEGILAEDPKHAKALAYKGLILLEKGQYPEAAAALELAVAQDPGSPQLRAALEEAKRGGPPPEGAAPPAAGGDVLARGTVTIDPAAQASLKGTETLFLSLSNPQRPGPPVAADVVRGPLTFPLSFDLTTADIRAMPGAGDVPATMDLKVRVDLDGNAMTKEPGTPSATITAVARGTEGLQVVLTLDGAPTAAPAGGGAPGGNPLLAPVAPPPGGGGGGAVLASGTATLAAGAAVTGGETVFLSVRDPAGGPPLAAKKLANATFPLTFELTEADVVQMGMARPIPASFNVSVRLDKDGNAMTKAGEPEALATGVAKGATGLSLELK